MSAFFARLLSLLGLRRQPVLIPVPIHVRRPFPPTEAP
jgi:hypothetical protein